MHVLWKSMKGPRRWRGYNSVEPAAYMYVCMAVALEAMLMMVERWGMTKVTISLFPLTAYKP
jgi:hypothetical protein